MLDKKDAIWWVQEAQQHPEAAPDLIRTLADRLAFLDKQNEELRGDLIALRRQRSTPTGAGQGDVAALLKRIQELEGVLNQAGMDRQLVVFGRGRVEANQPLNAAREDGLKRVLPLDLSMLLTRPGAALIIITEDARAFSVTSGALPVPADAPAPLGNPNNVAAILDAHSAGDRRFLVLVTSRGYVYSLLLGTVMQVAKNGDKLIRNLIPDDPVTRVIASYNADLFMVSEKGRWMRFPEKSIAGVGSLGMDLPKGDQVAGVVALREDGPLCLLTAEGRAFVRDSADFPAKRAPGGTGGLLLKGFAIKGITANEEVHLLTRRGQLISFKVKDLPFRAHSEVGTPIPGLSAEDALLTYC
jgi:DNA gyrase/topoisomerase IV subunit A